MSADAAGADPYEVLGVARTASDAEIKKAYRELAKRLHPDLHAGDPATEDRFKAVSAAYDFLRDPERRRRYDAGEIDATGAERPERSFYRHYAGSDRYEPAGGFEDFSDLFAEAFGARGGRSRRAGTAGGFESVRLRGADVRYHLAIDFPEAVNGARKRVTTPDGSTLQITVPPGVADGQVLRLAGQGRPGFNDGPPGDALVEIAVRAHPVFERDGADIKLELPISLDEAVLGASVDVPTPTGRIKLKVPAGSDSGRVLRLKGRGVTDRSGTAGDLLVRLKIVMPERIDEDLKRAVEDWRAAHPYDPRKTWKGRS